jgi:hypothetical protein
MDILKSTRRNVLWIGPLLAALLVAGCAGIKPYEPHDYRREGPKKGLFTGSEGEFVIYRKVDKPETGSEASNRSDENADGERQKKGSKEKKEETKSGE